MHVGLALEGLVRETEVTMHNQHSKWPVQWRGDRQRGW